MDYQLDTNAAKQADNLFSRIDQKGAYVGVFTRAEAITSKKGSKGVDFSFKSNTGATADYLTIWTHNGDGKQLMGFNTLMAIMTCLKVRSLTATHGEVEKYDPDTKSRIKIDANLFKELMDKPVGLLLHMEEYEKTAGGTAWKPAISAPFNDSRFTASEILNKAIEPTTLEKMEHALRDRPLKSAASTTSTATGFVPSDDGLGDDIPFN